MLFSEASEFFVRPDRALFWAPVQSMSFARPHFREIRSALDFAIAKYYRHTAKPSSSSLRTGLQRTGPNDCYTENCSASTKDRNWPLCIALHNGHYA